MAAGLFHDTDRQERYSAALVVVLVCVLTFGIFIPWFGVYYDETVSIYILNHFDFWHLLQFSWGQARPINAPMRWLLRDQVVGSHIVMLLIHIGNATLILFLLRFVMRGYLYPALLAAIFYCVYPLYWFRPAIINIAIDGSFFFFLSSFALGIAAVYLKGWRGRLSWAFGMIFLVLYFFTYELPFPLEVFRPLLFWRASETIGRANRKRLQWTFRRSLPWLTVAGGLGVYRLFIFKNSGFYKAINYNVPGFDTTPGQLDARAQVMWDQLVTTWSVHLPQILEANNLPGLVVAVLVLVLPLFHYWYFNRRLAADTAITQTAVKSLALAGAGLLIVVLGQVAVAAARQLPEIDGLASRWNLIAAAGAAIFFVSIGVVICNVLLRRHAMLALALLLSPMIATGTILQVQNDQQFVDDWIEQREFWWQLAEKIPDLQDNTTIIVDHDYRTARDRPVLIYETLTMGSLFYDNPTISVVASIQAIPGSWAFDNGNWAISWSYSLDRAIMVHMEQGCLTIIDPHAPLPVGVKLGPSAASLLPLLSASPAQLIKKTTDRSFKTRATYFMPKPDESKCPRESSQGNSGRY